MRKILARLNSAIGHEISVNVFRRSLAQTYEAHISRNSADVLAGLQKVDNVVGVVFSSLNLISAALIATFVIAALLFVPEEISRASERTRGLIRLASIE